MLALKRGYELAVETRNFQGIQLIDRNDQLCVLYEKASLLDDIRLRGDMGLRKREDEIRMLRIQVADAERSVLAARKRVPRIPELDQEVAKIKDELMKAQMESEQLSLALEDPDNADRWKRLEGKNPYPNPHPVDHTHALTLTLTLTLTLILGPIPDWAELAAKIVQLEERLNEKKDQLLEKHLVLEELVGLAERLRFQAMQGRSQSMHMATSMSEQQDRKSVV